MSRKVWLVGAGTGDIGLITVKGMKILQQAEVVIFDALLGLEMLSIMPSCAELIDAGKRAGKHILPQDEINRLLVNKAKEGKRVVRLKGGDPFVFGRGGEEIEALIKEGIDFEVVSGVTSSIAVPAYSGIPVTHRDYTSSFHVITGHKKGNGNLDINFKALVELDATLVFLMGAASLDNICQGLLEAGLDKDMPAAVIERGTTCKQRSVYATVSSLSETVSSFSIKAPVVIVIGKVCKLHSSFSWYEKLPLSDKQVLVTRPKDGKQQLVLKLREAGAHVIHIPMIETVKIGDACELEVFYSTVEKMQSDECKKCIVFTSKQGVKCFFELLKEQKFDVRKLFTCGSTKFAVIGSGTNEALEEHGIFADYMPLKYSSEDLGKLLVKEAKCISHIYIFRALEGSKKLTDRLREAGISYSDVTTYRTISTAPCHITDKIAAAFEDGEIDYVTFTSASAVKGFVSTFKGVDLKKVKAVCIGDKTAKEAHLHDMDVSVSKEATADSLAEAVLERAEIDGNII